MDPKTKEKIIADVTDLHALVTHGLNALIEQADNLEEGGYPDALAAVRSIHLRLEKHERALQARIDTLGTTFGAVKDAVSMVTGVVAGLVSSMRSSEAARSLRDDYTFINDVAMSYLILDTTATALGDRDTASLAEHGYRDAAKMLVELDRLMPQIVLEELRREGLPVPDVAPQVRRIVKDAWDRAELASTIH